MMKAGYKLSKSCWGSMLLHHTALHSQPVDQKPVHVQLKDGMLHVCKQSARQHAQDHNDYGLLQHTLGARN